MLGRAVQDHHPGLPGLKGTTLSQYHKANANSNALKPVPGITLNTTLPSWSQSSNPLKRKASQANGDDAPYSSQGQTSQKNVAALAQAQVGGGRVGKLHDTVFFDENDFEDDSKLDLDEDVSLSTGDDPLASESPKTLVPEPNQENPTNSYTPASSTPLPWSSSPLSHHNMPSPSKTPPKEAPAVNTTKRRTLPWLDAQRQQEEARQMEKERLTRVDRGLEKMTGGYSTQEKARIEKSIERRKARDADRAYEDLAGAEPGRKRGCKTGGRNNDLEGKGIPDFVMEKIKQARDGKERRAASKDSFTPLPKDKGNSKFPWNTTASAVKEQQKQLRQGHRKLVKDNEGDPVAKTNARKKKGPVEKVFLSDEQKSVLELVSAGGKSVFFTGSAGTGKSVLLREIINILRVKYKREPDRVAVTASTGLAACNVGGVTLHSFAGIGLGKEAVPELVKKIKRSQKAKARWLRTKVLIIDEISMVDGDLFDKLESIARAIRNNGRPFGGIQLVITGDFFQLPPVPDYGRISKFSFDAATWNTSVEHTIGLTQVFRQKDPGSFSSTLIYSLLTLAVFANMLNEMRLGKLTPKSINAFHALNRPLSFSDDFEATEL